MAFAYERQAMRGNLVLALIGIAAALYVVSLFRPQYEETNLKGPARVIDGDTSRLRAVASGYSALMRPKRTRPASAAEEGPGIAAPRPPAC